MRPDHERRLLDRLAVDLSILGANPIIRGRRLAVGHVLAMLVAGDTTQNLLDAHAGQEADGVRACLAYARHTIAPERIEASRLVQPNAGPGWAWVAQAPSYAMARDIVHCDALANGG